MKLSLAFVLVAIALCCYQADAGAVCPSVAQDLVNFFTAPDHVYLRELLKYDLSQQVVADRMELKQCSNNMSMRNRQLMNRLLMKIYAKCKE
ncbi:secretoglobin family 1D member 2-like [Sorex fumeus]|uniref:secretoglobin family 1D member 2-like n=1 Tax=Sorex fumeus TaxID=62283 RepID=UPI0024ACE663|nr:secretoglobin family 1D member 2-like [Sorex fumeus]XP_055987891.1 secretoglobin family 1D member 2-like [Sorex fumeus]XP_055987892.1 secretoglobin family 1D member 2-like [Sorex fumeus]